VLKTQAGVVAELPYKNLLLTGVYIVGFRLADLKKHKGWVGHLPCMCKILGSNPSTAKKKKKRKEKRKSSLMWDYRYPSTRDGQVGEP
jgi:hypothetical protein